MSAPPVAPVATPPVATPPVATPPVATPPVATPPSKPATTTNIQQVQYQQVQQIHEGSKQDVINKLKKISQNNIPNLDTVNNTPINLSQLYVLKNEAKSAGTINSILANLYAYKDDMKQIDNGYILYISEDKYNYLLQQFHLSLLLSTVNKSKSQYTYQDILNSY